MFKERLKIFRENVFKKNKYLDGFLVLNPTNLAYLSGFEGEGLALITKRSNFLFTDARYTEQAQKECPDFKIVTDELNLKDARIIALDKIINQMNLKKIAFESKFLNYSDYKKYTDSFKSVELVPFENTIEPSRMIKEKEEIIKIKKASQITTETLKEIIEIIKPGIRELDIAAELSYTMRKKGAHKEAFEIIVVSGERSSLIHGKPSEKKIEEGELIIIDMGSNYQQYNSDITRTIMIGKGNEKQKEIFSIVLEAQEKALEFIKPGVKCNEVDTVARNYIENKGYGKHFGHGLGHGVGLEIHESPRVSSIDSTILAPGMVVTIEPGIYLPGIGGVRIEDTVLITDDGMEILTWFPKILNL